MVEQRAVLKDVLLSSGAGSSPATATNIQARMRILNYIDHTIEFKPCES